jgi:GNAT superfamily N-acetyltransferase
VPVAAEPLLRGWYARLREGAGTGAPGRTTLVAVLSRDFPAGALVDLPGDRRPAGWQLAVSVDAGGRIGAVEVNLPQAPLLWYVELPEPDADPAATVLLAFSDGGHADGRLLTEVEARAARIGGDHQVAAVRWWPASGLVHQLYVAPAHRRRGVAGKLVQAAFGIQRARGLPDLHGDGRRTDLGETFSRALPDYAAWRLAPWSQRLPPMTPAGTE